MKSECGLAPIVADILGLAAGCKCLRYPVIAVAGTGKRLARALLPAKIVAKAGLATDIVVGKLKSDSVNLAKPTSVVLALGCLVSYLVAYDYS